MNGRSTLPVVIPAHNELARVDGSLRTLIMPAGHELRVVTCARAAMMP